MATNLIDLAKNYLTTEVIQKASALVGESPATTERALDTATPTIVAGLAHRASSVAGAETLKGILDEAGLTGAMGPISERLRGMSGEDLAQLGKDLLGRVLGGRMGPIVDAAAISSGVRTPAMSSLMGLAAPIVLGVLGHQIHTRKLDAAGIAGLLGEQKSLAASALPPAVSTALGWGGARAAASREPGPVKASSGLGRLWPLLLLFPILLFGALLLRKREEPNPEWIPGKGLGAGITPEAPAPPAPKLPEAPPLVEPPSLPAPAPAEKHAEAPKGAASPIAGELTQFLEGSGGEASRRFAFDDLNFEFATTHLTPGSLATLDQVVTVLKAHPGARVRVEGYTDDIGLPAANERLSRERADAVKSAFVARGVAADRVTTTGLGQEQPRASNDTAEGRAKNRRTELVITR